MKLVARILRGLTLTPATSLAMIVCAAAMFGGGLATWAKFTDSKALGANSFSTAKVAAPANFTGTSNGATVNLTWGAVTVPRSPAPTYTVTRGTTVVCAAQTATTCQVLNAPDGKNTYTVTARWGGFSAGSTTDVTVTADTTPPTATITKKAGQASPTNGAVAFTITFSEPVTGFDTSDISPAGATITGTGPSYTITYTPTADTSITPVLAANAVKDLAGLANTTAVTSSDTVAFDKTPPATQLTSPADNAWIRTGDALAATASSDTASVQFARSSDGTNWVNVGAADTTAPYGVSLPSGIADGTYSLRATATDAAGNTGTSAIRTIRVDNMVPTGSITTPAAIKSSVLLAADANDAPSGVAAVQFQSSAASAGTWSNLGAADTESPYNASVAGLPQGLRDFRAIVTDRAGNTFTTQIKSIVIDDTAPVANISSITSPAGSTSASPAVATHWGTLTVNTSATDAVGTVASNLLEGGTLSWTATGVGPYAQTVDSRNIANGSVTFRSTASDTAGNASAAATRTITVNNLIGSVTLNNGAGSAPGTAQRNDYVVIAFNHAIDAASLCGGTWTSQSKETQASGSTLTISDNGANDKLAFNWYEATVCPNRLIINVDLGGDYVSGSTPLAFGNNGRPKANDFLLSTDRKTLTLNLGDDLVTSGTPLTNATSGTASYIPDADLTAGSGAIPTSNIATTNSGAQRF